MNENKLSEDLLLDADAFDGQSFMMTAGEMRTYSERATVLESELALLRKAVSQLGVFHKLLTGLMSESRGVAGFHLNGDEACWGEFDFGSIDDDVLALIKEPEPK